MTEIGTLAELLELRRPAWRTGEGLLDCLSAVPLAPETTRERFAAALAGAEDVAWEDLAEWCRDWPSAPDDARAFEGWLHESEALGLAQEGLIALRLKDGVSFKDAAVKAAIDAVMNVAEPAVMARVDKVLFASRAAKREAALGFACAPWSWIASGSMGAFLSSSPDAARQACELWVEGQLAHADASLLAARLVEDDILAAYRAVITERTCELWVTRWNAEWSLDVARDESEVASAHRLLNLELPHSGKTLLVQQHVDGTWWSDKGLMPYSETVLVWGDATLGEMRTQVRVVDPSADEDAWHALVGLRRIASGESGVRACALAAAVIDSLYKGTMAAAITKAHEAFENGSNVGDDTLRLLDRSFEIRILLNDVVSALSADGDVGVLSKSLADADEAHSGHLCAAQLVSDELYADLTRALPLDEGSWWGSRLRLDRERSIEPRDLGASPGASHE